MSKITTTTSGGFFKDKRTLITGSSVHQFLFITTAVDTDRDKEGERKFDFLVVETFTLRFITLLFGQITF